MRMKDRAILTLAALALMVSPAAAGTILMDPTTNDGSFESNIPPADGSGFNNSPLTLPPVWTITGTHNGGYRGGLLSTPPPSLALPGANGHVALFSDGEPAFPNSTTATSFSLLGGAYAAVHEGDVFTWSFMVNSWSATSTGSLQLNFGGGPVTVGTGIAADTDLSTFVTYSGTYTATAADAAGGQLSVVFSIATGTSAGPDNVYGDNVQLSVEAVPEPGTITLLGIGVASLASYRVRRRRDVATD